MPLPKPVSAGLLLFRRREGELEVLLAHPGGPFWQNKDLGAWTIPKGVQEEGESLAEVAVREFREETGVSVQGLLIELGFVQQKGGKVVHCWASEGDADAAEMRSNHVKVEWPPRSGNWISIPEVDRCEWFGLEPARLKINVAQAEFLSRLQDLCADERAKH